jgi:hypothetical protein
VIGDVTTLTAALVLGKAAKAPVATPLEPPAVNVEAVTWFNGLKEDPAVALKLE